LLLRLHLFLLAGLLQRVETVVELRQPLCRVHAIIAQPIARRIKPFNRVLRQGIHPTHAHGDIDKAVLRLKTEGVQTSEQCLDFLDFRHGLSPLLLLVVPIAVLLLDPQPLGFRQLAPGLVLRVPHRPRLALRSLPFGRLRTPRAIRVPGAPHNAIAELPFGNIDVLPILHARA
jgi:hypothetical protein